MQHSLKVDHLTHKNDLLMYVQYSFIYVFTFCTPFRVSHVVWMRHWWQVSGITTCEPFPCTHPLTLSMRLDTLRVSFFKSSVAH